MPTLILAATVTTNKLKNLCKFYGDNNNNREGDVSFGLIIVSKFHTVHVFKF